MRSRLSDLAEAEALRAGLVEDLDAGFADLVRAYDSVVYSVALRLGQRPADAEDLAAEAFLRAYRALRGYDDARIKALRLRPWLLTILRNAGRNAARDAGRRPAPPPVEPPADPRAGGPSVEEQAEGSESRRELGALLTRLPDAQRTAVVLRHVAGLPIGEIADVLGVPEGTAKSHVSRGLQRLRALTTTSGRADR